MQDNLYKPNNKTPADPQAFPTRRDFLKTSILSSSSFCTSTPITSFKNRELIKSLFSKTTNKTLFTSFFTGKLSKELSKKFSLPTTADEQTDKHQQEYLYEAFTQLLLILNYNEDLPRNNTSDKMSLCSFFLDTPKKISPFSISLMQEYYRETLLRIKEIEEEFDKTGAMDQEVFENCKIYEEYWNNDAFCLTTLSLGIDSLVELKEPLSKESYKRALTETKKTLKRGLKLLSEAKTSKTNDWRAKSVRCLMGYESEEYTQVFFNELDLIFTNHHSATQVLKELNEKITKENQKVGIAFLNQLASGRNPLSPKMCNTFKLIKKHRIKTCKGPITKYLPTMDRVIKLIDTIVPESLQISSTNKSHPKTTNKKLKINQERSKSTKNLPISFKVVIKNLDEYIEKKPNQSQEAIYTLTENDKKLIKYLIGEDLLSDPTLKEVLFYRDRDSNKNYSKIYLFPAFNDSLKVVTHKKTIIIPHPEEFYQYYI